MSEGIGLETFELLDDIMMKSLYDNIIGKDRFSLIFSKTMDL